ncbi:MAG: tripartite tricarboxylate transporter substrate binding protein [Alphaproteobacteria bacterium]|nr:tripartite tricarboxylate transporter substrate binding protein [Alphaproteobacteria bacterium]
MRKWQFGSLVLGISAFVVGFAAEVLAQADDKYPSRPVRMVVSFAAGGPTDIVARVMSAKMSELLGQQFVVENRTGAGGNTGAADVAKAAPDGYTLLMSTVSTHAINPHYYKKIPYDAAKDFVPIGQVGVTPILLVAHPSVPAKDAKELVALVKANPGKYTYGSSGVGSILHLCGEQFRMLAGGINITHIPYRGSSQLMKDLIAGQISMAFDATPSAGPQVESGKIRALGGGMTIRLRTMPNLPTMDEQGFKGFDCYTWNAILAPAGTPQLAIERLNGAMQKAMADPTVIKRLQDVGVDPTPGRGPKEAAAFMKAELAKWGPIVKASGAQAD